MDSHAAQLRRLLQMAEGTTVVPGAVDVLSTVLFKRLGYQAIWAGGFMATGSLLGWPDANVIGLAEHSRFVQNIVLATDLPVLVDVDNGYGSAVNVIRTTREMERAGAAGIVIEDQAYPKRCGLFPGNRPIVTVEEMVGKINAALDHRRDDAFVIVARTDSFGAGLSVQEAVDRANRYAEVGADAVLPISKDWQNLDAFAKSAGLPVPMISAPTLFPFVTEDLAGGLGYRLMIQPLVAAQVMYKALEDAMTKMQAAGSPESLAASVWSFKDLTDLVNLDAVTEWESSYVPGGSTLSD